MVNFAQEDIVNVATKGLQTVIEDVIEPPVDISINLLKGEGIGVLVGVVEGLQVPVSRVSLVISNLVKD